MKHAILLKPLAVAIAALSLMSHTHAELPLQKSDESAGPIVKFESPEHQNIGASVTLQTTTGSRIKGDKLVVMPLRTDRGESLQLTFADMIWLSGDYIGEPDVSIGRSGKESDFQRNVDSYKRYKGYIPKIMWVYQQLLDHVKDNINSGNKLEISDSFDKNFNAATGGFGYGDLRSTPDDGPDQGMRGLYLQLATYDYDHFGEDATKAYLVGHGLALKLASKATNEEELLYAYAVEGYADHFMTDTFAAGHIRTPRKEIQIACVNNFPEATVGIFGTDDEKKALLAKLMHDYDGEHGLTMVNGQGDKWFAEGDKHFYTPENSENRQRVTAAVQLSADQVYTAYKTRNPDLDANKTAMLKLLPDFKATRMANLKSRPPVFDATYNDARTYLTVHFDKKYKKSDFSFPWYQPVQPVNLPLATCTTVPAPDGF